MVEFNPDGSIKLPSRMTKQIDENNHIFATQRAFRIIRNQTSTITPLTCELTIEPSSLIYDKTIVEQVFNDLKNSFKNDCGLSIKKEDNQYVVKIVSGFNRCAWCQNFINQLSDRTAARIIRTDKCENKFRNNFY